MGNRSTVDGGRLTTETQLTENQQNINSELINFQQFTTLDG